MKKSLMVFRTPLDQSQETDSVEVNSDRQKIADLLYRLFGKVQYFELNVREERLRSTASLTMNLPLDPCISLGIVTVIEPVEINLMKLALFGKPTVQRPSPYFFKHRTGNLPCRSSIGDSYNGKDRLASRLRKLNRASMLSHIQLIECKGHHD